MNTKFKKHKRVLIVFLVFCFLYGCCIGKMYYIQKGALSLAADAQFSRSITLNESRGYIYDNNMIPLVNAEKTYKSIMFLNENTKNLVNSDDYDEIKNGIYVKTTACFEQDDSIFVKNYYEVNRYSENQTAAHIVGYIGADGGVCGIEKAFDRILDDAKGKISLNYNSDANGYTLFGDGIFINNENYDSPAGVRLTIDKDIQRIAEEALASSSIECGAVVILDVKSAEIRAVASVPCYDVNDVEAALDSSDMPFLNRALCAYPVGSVFKPIVSAAAIESGVSVYKKYECKGSVSIGTNTFSCYNHNAHGIIDLNGAIENSCNSYFIETGIETGADKISETAKLFGFGEELKLCSAITSYSGYLPDSNEITSDSELANLCFGQGTLLATPLQLAAAYNVFANNGIYIEPSLLKELIDENGNAYAYYKPEESHYVISEKTCEIINNCLYNNMLNGTGAAGCPSTISAAGKTATAQTGRYDENNDELLCTWFAGFFPYENPEYTIVVFNEKGSLASVDCAPVFRNCIERIVSEIIN